MTIDLDAMATAIAARYVPAVCPHPAGLADIRSQSANPPGAIGPTPAVVVMIDQGDFITGNGTRKGAHSWFVRFYFDQTSDLERTEPALRKWLNVLLYAHLSAIQLSGTVVWTKIESYRVGVLAYAGVDYTGIEFVVHTATSEPWAAVA